VKFVGLNRGILSWLVDDICASPDGSVMLNGAQDNGTSQRVGTTGEWRQVGPADGYACAVNRADPSIFLVSWQNERMTRLTNRGETVQMSTGLNESEKNRLFRTIIRQHPTEAGRLFTATKRKIWQSNDTGLTWFEATKEMPLIDSVSDFSISSADGNRMVLVDTKCQVLESTDGGANWTRLGECPVGRLSSAVRGEKEDANVLYIASKSPLASRERVWRSSDKGATWQPISRTGQENGLPDLPIFSFEIDPKSKNVLWAGTFIGLYRSADGGATWKRHGAGLPNVPVTDMVFINDENNVLVGTAGRGIWQASVGTRPAAVPTVPSSSGPSVNALTANFSFTPANPRPGRTIEFIDESTGAVSWNWDFSGQKSSAQVNPSHVFANPGTYAVKLTVSDGTNTTSFTRNITVAYPDTGTGSVLTYLVPVLVRAGGQGGTAFDTELTLTNRSGKSIDLTFSFKGGFDGTATYSMPPGQKVFPQAFEFLKSNGMSGVTDTAVGSLRIAVSGPGNISEFSAQARVTTPPNTDLRALGVIGRFGLAYPATPLTAAANSQAILFGLQHTSDAGQKGARSNVACVNAGGTASPKEITLEVSFRNGETGLLSDSKETKTLQPFEFFQWNGPLKGRGIKQGWAQIKKTGGDDQFVCYATIVDNLNGDGAYVPMAVVDTKLDATESMLPVVLDAGGYKSELTIANRTPRTLSAEFAFVNSNGEEEWGELDVPPLSQTVWDDIVGQLREAGFNAPAGSTIGSMYLNFAVEEYEGGKGADMEEIPISASDVYVGVRTYEEPGSGEKGRFGLAYGSLPLGQAADTSAYIYGLQQTGTRGTEGGTRSNIAFIHALGGDATDLTLEVTYFDDKAVEVGKDTVTLKPGQFKQIGTPLANRAEQGYARVTRVSGNDQFITYGVLNDQGNNDGSFITMTMP
jgi:PKD repeat protein